jgi:spore coat protein U-like protein
MRLGAGPSTVGYQLYRDSGRTQVWGDTAGLTYGGTGDGATQSIPVYGRVPAQAPQPSGTYVDTVTATVTF